MLRHGKSLTRHEKMPHFWCAGTDTPEGGLEICLYLVNHTSKYHGSNALAKYQKAVKAVPPGWDPNSITQSIQQEKSVLHSLSVENNSEERSNFCE